ncbi:type I restriction endonuclease [Bacteroides sp. UBA939]|uniref:type I restriction endonuclease n=1 Tax=Bacteroides sp. UBA939 TaxID=1946092 RepID=UPI0025BD0428|nr:type I restriction endonuclease [Bacteroides sp. UBA939]
MDFKDAIKQLADRIGKLKENIHTEEATKNAFIMPFINSLGYDVFNPLEVIPEMICDIGIKKGEKIDYAIMKNDEPILLIECKHWKQDLNLHDNQLIRYFHVSKAKFGLLTNGIIYKFYTDLKEANRMDEKPFLEIDITDMKDNQMEELKKFHKSYFDINNILTSASELKYMGELKNIIQREFSNPSTELVKLLAKQVYDGTMYQNVIDQFTPLVKKSISSYINDIISERLKGALKVEEKEEIKVEEPTTPVEDSKIVTTEEELEAFRIIRAICRSKVDVTRIVYRDAQTYFSILLDDNNRKAICRMYFNTAQKYVATIDENKKDVKHPILSLDELYNFTEEYFKAIDMYETK